MASMASTVATGSFHQPVLRPGTAAYEPPDRLSSGVDSSLRSMMHQVVTDGTAAPQLSSLPGYVGAKTGSAQVDGQIANGWLIAFDGDVAVGCVAQAGGSGVGAAGPVVRAILDAAA
jgi:cell division protein FtsI/penicillin-binding protein 2